ncbi:MAG: hypothetical protein KA201_18155 [Kofleriaceae bacterium]|nr:hypothetical protein [Kofleriaceae bacterium]
MRRTALGLLLVAAACGDNLAPAVMIESTGAAWIATRGAPDQPWVRHDGARASFDADPTGRPYDVVVVCRADAGEGWALTAGYEDGLAWSRPCATPAVPTVAVGFDLTSPADEVRVRDRVGLAPATDVLAVPAGVSDVVAVTGGAGAVSRIQIQRGLEFTADRRVALDVAGRGADLVPVEVTFDGRLPTTAVVRLLTAGGTAIPLSTTSARVVPTALVYPGDIQSVEVTLGDAWARAAIDEQAVDLPPPGASPRLAFAGATRPTWSWRRVGSFRATLALIPDGVALARWTLYAYPTALDARTVDGVVTQALVAPDVAGWDPAWWPSAPYSWLARLTRDREDGGSEGFTASGTIAAP